MYTADSSPLGGFLILLGILWWMFHRAGVFRGFSTGFWSGFFTRLFVGTLRTRSGSGLLEGFIRLLVAAFIVLVVLALAAQK